MAGFLAAALPALAQNPAPLNPPSPFAPPPSVVSPSAVALSVGAAERAHDLGFLAVATSLYRQLLDAPGMDKPAITLALATVLLDAGQAAEADRLLATLPEPRGAAWRLRAGLAALQLRERDRAQAQWDAIRAEEIREADRPWYHFFTGALYDTANPRQEQRANDFYVLAENGAPTELARARFQLAAERVRLREQGPPSQQKLDATRQLFEQWQGRELSYEPARQYAVMLALAGRQGEAVQFLRQNVVLGMPPQERAWRDEFNFLIGVLGDKTRNGVGRAALVQLIASGTKVQRQRQALQLLADHSPNEPERGHFRAELTRWVDASPPHPLRESVLFFRAQLALSEKDFAMAEDSARRLLQEFPASNLRLHAHGVLTQSAWEQQRYRLAAASAREARAALPPAGGGAAGAPDAFAASRADLGVLEAEAWFRLGEYRNAADAYAAVLRDRSPGLEADRLSALIYQRVLAEIRADATAATALLDQFAHDPAFKLTDRWEAEWNLARALQVQGKVGEAYARVGRLLAAASEGTPAAALPAPLHARMAWLQAKLAFDSDRFEATLAHVEALVRFREEIPAALREEITSDAVLLQAQAELNLNREPAALATLKRLREQAPNTDAAVRSYLIESNYYAQQEKIPAAQQLLTGLIDNPAYARNENVPYALFQLALLSERLGQEKDLEEANRRIEQLVTMEGAGREGDLIFAARLKQGDLLRRLSQFPQAQRAYEYLVNNYARRSDIVLAQLALADCHHAQSATDPAHAENAQLLYQQLRDRVDAPDDVRVEAGFKLGYLLARRGQPARAAEVWWRDVADPFLVGRTATFGVADKRPYWLARTLLELGKLEEDREQLEQARKAYQLILDARLAIGETLAKDALKRLGVPETSL